MRAVLTESIAGRLTVGAARDPVPAECGAGDFG